MFLSFFYGDEAFINVLSFSVHLNGYQLNGSVFLFFFFLFLEANFKIESEYIKRYLGELTPFQESCLVQLKKWMADAHQGKVSSRYYLFIHHIFFFAFTKILEIFRFSLSFCSFP